MLIYLRFPLHTSCIITVKFQRNVHLRRVLWSNALAQTSDFPLSSQHVRLPWHHPLRSAKVDEIDFRHQRGKMTKSINHWNKRAMSQRGIFCQLKAPTCFESDAWQQCLLIVHLAQHTNNHTAEAHYINMEKKDVHGQQLGLSASPFPPLLTSQLRNWRNMLLLAPLICNGFQESYRI